MSVFYDLNKTPRNILNQAIVRAIVSENDGAWFDPSDLSTLYQDAAGTIPVTAVEQPAGKMLDKSGNGYHATQSITASRPVLSARYNLLVSSEDASSLAWSKHLGSVVNVITSNPLNASVVSKFVPSETTGVHRVAQAWNPIPGVKYTQQVLLKSAGVRYVYINLGANADARLCVDLQTGQFVTGGISSELGSVVSIGDGWYLCTITGTGTSQTGNNTWFQANGSLSAFDDPSYVGSGSNGFYLIAADLRTGTIVNKYQRVNTATDYDTDERYFKKYLRFDGVDDYLNLPYMGLYANGSASVVAGVQLQRKAITQYIIGETTSAPTSSRYGPLAITTDSPLLTTLIRSDSNVEFINSTNIFDTLQPLPSVTSVVDTGNNISMRTKGVLVSTANYSRTSTLTANTTAIGALAQSTAVFFAQMNLYSLIITKSALSDAQRIACERHLSRKSGVQL